MSNVLRIPTSGIADPEVRYIIEAFIKLIHSESRKSLSFGKSTFGDPAGLKREIENGLKSALQKKPGDKLKPKSVVVRGDNAFIAVKNESTPNEYNYLVSLIGETGGGAGDSIRYAKITDSTNTWEYTADIYDNPDDDPIEEDATVYVHTLMLASGETIPNDALLAVRQGSKGTGESAVTGWIVIELPRSL